jgi:hypothetical protein
VCDDALASSSLSPFYFKLRVFVVSSNQISPNENKKKASSCARVYCKIKLNSSNYNKKYKNILKKN